MTPQKLMLRMGISVTGLYLPIAGIARVRSVAAPNMEKFARTNVWSRNFLAVIVLLKYQLPFMVLGVACL